MKCSECGDDFTPDDPEQDVCEDCQAEYSRDDLATILHNHPQREEALFKVGQIIGMALSLPEEAWLAAQVSEGLAPEYRRHVEAVRALRIQVMVDG